MKLYNCPQCREETIKPIGDYNRALKRGYTPCCSMDCAGLRRRSNKTSAQKKEEKRIYDIKYKTENKEKLKKEKKLWFRKTYNPEKAAIERKKNMARHVKYCQSSKYKEWKKQYDTKYRAKKNYGEYWESFVLLSSLKDEIYSRVDWYTIKYESGLLNKQQQRRRDYDRLNSN